MGIENTEKEKTKKKRLSLGDVRAARASLCKLMRQYYNKEIDHATFRNKVYSFNTLLAYDKQITENDLNKRIDLLEQVLKGTGHTTVDPAELENPYTADLKKRLAESEQVKSGIEQRLLETEKELKLLRSKFEGAAVE
jgi:hypothetical protein